MAINLKLDPSALKAFEGAAAGHDGVLSDPSGELLIKPSTQQEIDFYQQTLNEHPEFSELIPKFMGTLSLGASAQALDLTAVSDNAEESQAYEDKRLHGKAIDTQTAIVLENLSHGFSKANVLDIKLGSKLYKDGTPAEKAARLDKVASDTTSGSLNFRIAGMTVWNGESFDTYDKFYGRKFNADDVNEGFRTFFRGLTTGVHPEQAVEVLETIDAEIAKIRHILERNESRMYSASILIVYEGDVSALKNLMGRQQKAPSAQEKAPTLGEVKASEEDDDDEEDPVACKVKMIDFAHANWTPGEGKDENVITGLRNIEKQMDLLISG